MTDSRPPRQRLMGIGEIARTFKVTAQTARAWSGRNGFPVELDYVGGRPVWDGLEVTRWVAASRPRRGRPPNSH